MEKTTLTFLASVTKTIAKNSKVLQCSYILKYFFKRQKEDFQLQYFSNKSVFSRTHISDNIELMTCYPNWTEADCWNQEIH